MHTSNNPHRTESLQQSYSYPPEKLAQVQVNNFCNPAYVTIKNQGILGVE